MPLFGKSDEAEKHFKESAKYTKPTSKEFDLDKAIHLLEEAVMLKPDNKKYSQKLEEIRQIKVKSSLEFLMMGANARRVSFPDKKLGIALNGTIEQGGIQDGDDVFIDGFHGTIYKVDSPTGKKQAGAGQKVTLAIITDAPPLFHMQLTGRAVEIPKSSEDIVASYKKGRVQFTDTSIRTKRLFSRLEVPYYSVKGCTFRNRERDFYCIVRYVDRSNREKEANLASSTDATAHEIYTHILQVCNRLGHKIVQYPDPKMVRWRDQLERFGVACEFIEPSVDDFRVSRDNDHCSWRRDLGGFRLRNPNIDSVTVRESGWAEYEDWGPNAHWRIETDYYFDFVVRVSSVPPIACKGSPIKKFRVRMVGYNWQGPSLAQTLNDDADLREMLVKAKAPPLELNDNHILINNCFPSARLFRCLERIAEHVRREVGR